MISPVSNANKDIRVSSKKIQAQLVNGRVIVWNIEDAKHLYKMGFYGKYIGIRKAKDLEIDKPLELSLVEALYLLDHNVIEIVDENGRKISREEFIKIAKKNFENFDDVYLVYSDLRRRGFVVKSGLKFGTTFAVYEHGPGIDHAPFLVHVLPYNEKLNPLEIIRAGRLSHSVRKKFVIATIEPNTKSVRYFVFKWFA